MTVDWHLYQPYIPVPAGQPATLTRSLARQRYEVLMRSKSHRLAELQKILPGRTQKVLSFAHAAVQDVNDWFVEELSSSITKISWPSEPWESVCSDLSIYLGEALIEHNPHLYWEFFTWGKKNVSYQSAVIMGFRRSDPKFHINMFPERIVLDYQYSIFRSLGITVPAEIVAVKGVKVDVESLGLYDGAYIQSDKFWRLLIDVAAGELS